MPKIADVVLVTDDVAVRNALKFSLEVEGLTVRLFDGYAALLVASDPCVCRCLVIEHCLPWLDGLELLEILRTRHVHLPVVLFTSRPHAAMRRRAAQLVVRRILEMPFTATDFLDAVRAAMETG